MAERQDFLLDELGEAERVAVTYAPRALQPRYRALLTLDAVLQRSVSAAQEPILAQVRLAWWRDACARLPAAEGSPILGALASEWGAGSDLLGGLVDAWEAVAVGGPNPETLEMLARARAAACESCAGEGPGQAAGAARCWTFAAFAADGAVRMAGADAAPPSLPLSLRPLAVLDGLGRRALRRGGGPLLGDRLSPFAAMRLGIFGR